MDKLDGFLAGLASDLASAQSIAPLISAARAEVEAVKSADSLKLFDEAAASLSAGDLKAMSDGLSSLRTALERSGVRNYLTMLDELGVDHPLARDSRRQLAAALY